jgi:hypothetical protein
VLLSELTLDAFDLHSHENIAILCKKEQLNTIVELIKSANTSDVESYINESVATLLSRLTGKELRTSSGQYKYSDGDVLVILKLKEKGEVTESDLEINTCLVLSWLQLGKICEFVCSNVVKFIMWKSSTER